jgi:hypothetical protein
VTKTFDYFILQAACSIAQSFQELLVSPLPFVLQWVYHELRIAAPQVPFLWKQVG